MPRPTVLVATTDPAMAYALTQRLDKPCLQLGLKLEVCPGGDGDEQDFSGKKVKAYECAEALFDHLASVARERPMDLADTLVILDVGARLAEAFAPAASNDDGWHRTNNRAGVAVELILRFPQVFPVMLSPAVPIPEGANENRKDKVICPDPPSTTDGQWRGFQGLRDELQTAQKYEGQDSEPIPYAYSLMALKEPLHFVSPLDCGHGLRSTLARFARGMRCWFDPTGLRTLVKNRFLGTLFGSNSSWHITKEQRDVLLQRLDHVAVAVDEEREFAMLNAYTAYKLGRRAWMVTTYKEFNDKPLWTASADHPICPCLFWQVPGIRDVVVLRDIDLRFPDFDPLTRESAREELKSVASSRWKCCVGEDWRIWEVSSHPKLISGDRSLAKPITSLYELTNLLEVTKEQRRSVFSELESVTDKGTGGHGAPYLNLAMAESLLRQAKRCQDGPMENLLGALLAHEAYELLLGMSKTTALEALLLVHKKEVAAEVEFPGVSHDISITKRRADVEKTLEALYKTETNDSGKEAKRPTRKVIDMFLSQFWAELRLEYKKGEQFKAAEAANTESLVYSKWLPWVMPSRLRRLQRSADTTWTGVRDYRLFKKVIECWPLRKVGAFLWWLFGIVLPKRGWVTAATTFSGWVHAATVMVFGSSVLYGWLGQGGFDRSPAGLGNYLSLLEATILTSFGLQLTERLSGIVEVGGLLGGAVAIAHIGLSYVLFGLLVSMLYRKVTRG